jgi:diguanylate cyclase (GGDEF)-like protein/PAS domain S-box-containing protein
MTPDNQFATALRFMSNGLILVGADGLISLFNDKVLSLFGLGPDSIWAGMPLDSFLQMLGPHLGWNQARIDNVIANHAMWISSPNPTKVQHHFEDGTVLRIGCNPMPLGGAILTYDDVTDLVHATSERERVEGEARQTERQLALLVSGITDYAIYLVSHDGTIMNWNAGAERAKGYSAKEIVGRNFAMFWPRSEQRRGKPQRALQTALSTGRCEAEGWQYRKDGTRFWAHVLISPLYENDGSLLGFAKVTRDMTEQRQAAEQIAHMAQHDLLTGLPNRARFLDRLDGELLQAKTSGTQVAVVNIDLDGFKAINDTHGHAVGDQVLKTVAARIIGEHAAGEIVSRFGGDEFVGLKAYADDADLKVFLGRLQTALTSPIQLPHVRISIGASFGVASYPADADDRDKLLDNADLAMYRSKGAVDDKICFFDRTMDESARDRRALASDLWLALERDEFDVHYQRQCDANSGVVVGYEALLRWRHPIRGLVSAAEFIPIAEECGAILPIGEWVLQRACEDAVAHNLARVAVNLSAVQLGSFSIVEKIQSILLTSGLSPSRLELEVTETAVIADRNLALRILRSLKAFGISIALDDFGTGYSSLDTLRTFPFDRVKLDRSFAQGIESDPRAQAFVIAMKTLGHSLELSVLAEGVETSEQLAMMGQSGLDEVQGYFLGVPEPIRRQESARTAGAIS